MIEPVVADNWAADIGTSLPWTQSGERWYRYPTWLSDVDNNGNPLPAGQRRFVPVDQYERTLRPALLDEYVQSGYCWLVIGSLQAGRAFASAAGRPGRRRPTTRRSPTGPGSSTTSPHSPGASARCRSTSTGRSTTSPVSTADPGPEMSVYRLSGGKCGALTG